MTNHDDELGEFLRSEVPEPGADYWSNIDSMLDGVESQREEIVTNVQTDDNVIRLTDMTVTQTPPVTHPQNRSARLLVAAALVVVVGFGMVFAINRSQTTVPLETTNDGAPPASTPAPGEDVDSTSTTEAQGDAISTGRTCYSDGTVVITIDVADNGSFTGWQVPVGFAAGIGDTQDTELHLAPNGGLLLTLAGIPDPDSSAGLYRVSESSVAAFRNGFSSISTSQWSITSELLTQAGQVDEARFPAIDCGDSSDDLTILESTPVYYPPDFAFQAPTISQIDTMPGQNRVCYTLGENSGIFIFDFTDDGALANALMMNPFQTISATKTFDSETTYSVATLNLGDRENGRDTITTVLWEIDSERIAVSDGEEFPAIDCATVADQVAQADDFLGEAPYPAYPVGS